MTISQGGTGSGGSGDAVRRIYQALYGVDDKGNVDNGKALLPTPQGELPKFNPDGTAIIKPASYTAAPAPAGPAAGSPASAPALVPAAALLDAGSAQAVPAPAFLDQAPPADRPASYTAADAALEPGRGPGRGRA